MILNFSTFIPTSRQQIKNISLRVRLTSILFLLILLPSFIISGAIFVQTRLILEEAAQREVQRSNQALAQDITTMLEHFQSDLQTLRQAPSLAGLLRTIDNNGVDPLNGDTTEIWAARLEQNFSALAETVGYYHQLRYINEQGMELVQVDYRDSQVFVVATNQLEDQSNSDDFVATLNLDSQQLYISDISLNQEAGEIQRPYVPVIRLAVPVIDQNGQRRGIIISTVYATHFLSNLNDSTAENRLINAEGYYLYHPTPERQFGFLLGTSFNAQTDYAWGLNQLANQTQFVGIPPDSQHIQGFYRLNFDPLNPNRYWILIKDLSESRLLSDLQILRQFVVILVTAILIITAGISIILIRQTTEPMLRLGQSAEQVALGNYNVNIDPAAYPQNEVGLLAQSFQKMVETVRNYIKTLEIQVADRTYAVEATANISRQLTAIRDPDDLLKRAVTQLQNAFAYTHLHIYRLNLLTSEIEFSEGTGPAAARFKRINHTLRLGEGVLGQVIETGEVYWSNNLAAEMVDDATVLPKVNARLIIPLQASGQVLGLLDIQDEQPERFDQNQGNLLRTLADQLAVTLENAILFEGMQLELEELEALNRRLTQSTWHQVTSEVTSSGYVFTPQGIQATNDEWLATMTEAIQLRQLSTLPAPDDPTKIKTATLASTEHSSAAVPLVLRGQVIGVIGVERYENQAWSEDEIVTLQSVSDQVALALDSARLAEETQRRAAREQTIAQLTQRVWASDDIESILRNAVTGLGSTLRASKVVLQLRSAGAKPAPETPDSAIK